MNNIERELNLGDKMFALITIIGDYMMETIGKKIVVINLWLGSYYDYLEKCRMVKSSPETVVTVYFFPREEKRVYWGQGIEFLIQEGDLKVKVTGNEIHFLNYLNKNYNLKFILLCQVCEGEVDLKYSRCPNCGKRPAFNASKTDIFTQTYTTSKCFEKKLDDNDRRRIKSLIHRLETHNRKGGKDILLRLSRLESPFSKEAAISSCRDYKLIELRIFMNLFHNYSILRLDRNAEGTYDYVFYKPTWVRELLRIIEEEQAIGHK